MQNKTHPFERQLNLGECELAKPIFLWLMGLKMELDFLFSNQMISSCSHN
jgi:hypothetical protein